MSLAGAFRTIAERVARLLAFEPSPERESLLLDEAELQEQLHVPRSGLLLGIYDEHTVQRRLEEEGFLGLLRERVREDVAVRLDPDADLVRVYRTDRLSSPEGLLVELKLRREVRLPNGPFPGGDMLILDWTLMQNPGAPFRPERPPLPGQKHPGLGVGRELVRVLKLAAARLACGGLIGVPAYFHNAVMYHQHFVFLDPVEEGRFQALMRDTASLGFVGAAWAVHRHEVREPAAGAWLAWRGANMLLPLAKPLRDYIAGDEYVGAAARAFEESRFEVVPRSGQEASVPIPEGVPGPPLPSGGKP